QKPPKSPQNKNLVTPPTDPNAYLKSEQERLATKKALERTEEDKDDLKRQLVAQRKIEIEKKHNKESNDFKSEFIKLQEQKG
ncbi:19275_t:CDS:2, partial [Funneliformis geosporum]